MNALLSCFTRHPSSVGESYLEHAAFAGWFAVRLLGAGMAALVHAILPFAFERTASTMIRDMHAAIDGRGAPANSPAQARTR